MRLRIFRASLTWFREILLQLTAYNDCICWKASFDFYSLCCQIYDVILECEDAFTLIPSDYCLRYLFVCFFWFYLCFKDLIFWYYICSDVITNKYSGIIYLMLWNVIFSFSLSFIFFLLNFHLNCDLFKHIVFDLILV